MGASANEKPYQKFWVGTQVVSIWELNCIQFYYSQHTRICKYKREMLNIYANQFAFKLELFEYISGVIYLELGSARRD